MLVASRVIVQANDLPDNTDVPLETVYSCTRPTAPARGRIGKNAPGT